MDLLKLGDDRRHLVVKVTGKVIRRFLRLPSQSARAIVASSGTAQGSRAQYNGLLRRMEVEGRSSSL